MSLIPSPSTGQGKPTAVTPRRVSPCERGDIVGAEHFFTRSMTSLQEFALQINNTLADLKTVGRCLGLRVTTTGRGIHSPTLPICDRIAFGLKARAIASLKVAKVKAKINLFKFGYHTSTGFYQPSE